ncbi:MAG: GTP cyclohydrolase MptA [Synergistaceae bacterium]|jgi:GTP cyclohydrolase-4|nr:GTP cyclohydrolase MptA [Synergistaceae bacterium]
MAASAKRYNLGNDIQNSAPDTRVELTRVGVTGLKRMLRLKRGPGRGNALFFAEMDMFARLSSERSGVHMSRFIENIEDVASSMASESAPDIETLGERMALAIARTQGTERAEIRIRAQFPMKRRAPISRAEVEDLYTFVGIAVSDGRLSGRVIGVEATGLTVCPCAMEMVTEQNREALAVAGYSREQVDEISSLVTFASHNQRGKATLLIGTQTPIRAEELAEIAEGSMSSEIYELLKRPDELHVVNRAHSRPRFAEDVVREMIRGVSVNFAHLADDTFVLARQENFESIHAHCAYAERCGLLGNMRDELEGKTKRASVSRARASSLESWLDSLLQ